MERFLFFSFLSSLLLLAFLFKSQQVAADADPLDDFECYGLPSNFVVRNVFATGELTDGPGGHRAALNVKILPALRSQGITFVHFRLLPCGINKPHMHPRATELISLISGGPIQAGFVDTQGRSHINILYPGDITIFPRAMMHFELNIGNQTAFFVSALNSENPGTLVAGDALMSLPLRAAGASMNQATWRRAQQLKDGMAWPYSPRLELATLCQPGQNITTEF